MKILIKNGHVIDVASNIDKVCDVMIEDGKITEIGEITEARILRRLMRRESMCYRIGRRTLSFKRSGFEYKEDIESGTKSASLGGFTSIACMPNTSPVIDNAAIVNYIINKSKQEGLVNVYPIGAISKGQNGEELAEIGDLKSAGAVAISDETENL